MTLDEQLEALLLIEGGYSNKPPDPETMYGITVDVARANGYIGPMISLPKATAKAIYKAKYWFDPNLNRVQLLSQALASMLFDCGVNQGVGTAGKFLQRALNCTTKNKLVLDGEIGNSTIMALGQFLTVRFSQGETVLLRMINAQRCVSYMADEEANPSDDQFLYGWVLNRIQ
jgi:lysozyme family protein